ncbi:MAG: PhnD/SsuA/transferrin family substrate-binding protein [Ignavibacteriae bacterium]|nr:PhnD/SsuA/transferrin family substrate-binding protein [Ignavibacteriota bacterium]MCB9259068.1 PhnD/SsuA/transferrin family substrate-binding protein [Ignavibacteriales bacterium]
MIKRKNYMFYHFHHNSMNKILQNIILISLLIVSNVYPQNEIRNKFTLGISTDIFEDINLRDAKVTLKLWGQLLISEMPIVDSLNIVVYENVESIIEDSKKNKIDIMYISSLMYAKYEDKINLTPAISTKSNYQDFYHLDLLSNTKSNAEKFEDLKNSTILIQGGKYKQIAELWLDYLALQSGVKDKYKFFKKVEFVEKPMQAVLPIFMNKADYCIVNSVSLEALAELNPQITKGLKHVFSSQPLNNDLICINKNLTPKEKKLVTDIALNFKTMPKNEQLFKIFKTIGAGKFKESDLEGIRSLLKNYKNLLVANKP